MTIRAFLLRVAALLLAAVAVHAAAQAIVTTQSSSSGGPPQVNAPTTGTGLILGKVIDMGTGSPVAGAIVTLGGTSMLESVVSFGGGPMIRSQTPSAIGGSDASDLRVLTDGDGQFVFRDLPKGSFGFSVSVPGYTGGGYGQRRPTGAFQPLDLADGQKRGDVMLPVWKYGAISGTVTDETGEPLVGVNVSIIHRIITAGHAMLDQAGQGRTDDRGVYRAGSLVPGEYLVAVVTTQRTTPVLPPPNVRGGAGPSASTSIQVGNVLRAIQAGVVPPPPEPGARSLAYDTAYYSNAHAASDATAIVLAPGEEHANVDLQLRLSPAVRISGHVTGPDGPATGLAVHLVPIGRESIAFEPWFEAGTATTDAAGAFTLVDISPGRYMLRTTRAPTPAPSPSAMTMALDTPTGGRASMTFNTGSSTPPIPTEPMYWANVPLTVGEADLSDLNIALRPGIRFTGRARFDGTKAPPNLDTLKSINVMLLPSDGSTPAGHLPQQIRGPFDATGQFALYSVPPGRYVVRATMAPAGWTFKGAICDGRDVSTMPLALEGADVSGVDIVFTDRAIALSGTVTGASGADADATVLLFPTDSQRWTDNGPDPRQMKTARATATGTFTFSNVPEGDYFVTAVPDIVAGDWPDPALLQSLRGRATRITLNDGDTKTLHLQTIK